MTSTSAASAPPTNGLTPAQRLAAQHSQAQSVPANHHATVEDVVDDQDLAYPPPPPPKAPIVQSEQSVTPASSAPQASSTLDPPVSAKAAGKQKMKESEDAHPRPIQPSIPKNAQSAPNTSSEEAFPSLGTPKVGNQSPWSNQPPSTRQATLNGFSNASSRSATPVTSAMPPAMNFPASRGQGIVLPGRHSHSITLNSSHLKPRSEMKKPIQEILRDLQRRSKATVEMKSASGAVTFQAQGPTLDSVHQILKDVVAQVGAKQSVKVPIPVSVRPFIIGKQGVKIQEIEKRTGAKIRLAKQPPGPMNVEDDDATVDVEIEGDAITAEAARREIEAIAGQRTSSVNMRMRHIAPEYFPFIAGAHNARISAYEDGRDVRVKIPQYHTWSSQPPSSKSGPSQIVGFRPQDGYHILISGEREAAKQIQADIESQVAQLQHELNIDHVPIPRERHSFVLGDQENSMHDFLEETGCSVIMPPASSDSEALTIVGPEDQIENAANKVMDLAMSMQMQSLDVARLHPQTPNGPEAHSRDLMRYLYQRQALRDLEGLHGASVVIPEEPNASSAWQVYARDGRNAIKARTDLINLVSGHPPTRFRNLPVHPYHQHQLQKHHAKVVRDKFGVHLIFAEPQQDNGPLLLVYEGLESPKEYKFPQSRPSASDLAQFEHALAEAEKFIIQQLGDEKIIDHSVEAPSKYREKIQRFMSRQDRDAVNLVQLLESNSRHAQSSATANGNYPICFRGPSRAVNDYQDMLQSYIEEQIRDEAERDYTTSCDFPQRFANQLIGRRGENINKIRDEFDVDINVGDNKVEIKGPKAKADAARFHVISFAKKQEDEATHVLKIKPQFHGDLIGAKGSQVSRLQDRYRVRIYFPRNTVPSPDEQSVAEGNSDAGASTRPRRSAQAPDEVHIKGPRRGADEARDEVLSLYQYLQDHSHSAVISVSQSLLPSLIGSHGRELNTMRMNTGAQIDIPSKAEDDGSGRVDIKLRGTKSQVESAQRLIREKSRLFDQTVNRTMDVDQRHYQALIGRGGENIRKLVVEAGGPSEPRDRARLISFPQANAPDQDVIRLEGQEDVVERLMESIESFVRQREQQVTQTINVPPERHGMLIGRGGETRRGIESEHKVQIAIPSTSVTGPARSVVKVIGMPENVAKAKEKVESMVKGQEGETMNVPQRLYHAIVDSGEPNFFQALNRDLQVKVDHGGHSKPAKPDHLTPPKAGSGSSNLPLITDAAIDMSTLDVEEHHTWDVLRTAAAAEESDEGDTMPWIIRGDAQAIAQAKERLIAAIAAAERAHTGFLVIPDPRAARFVIGPGGSTINKIRRETGCKIDVPRGNNDASAIKIQGERDDVEQAKEMVLEAIINGNTGRN